MWDRFELGRPLWVVVALSFLIAGVAATAARTVRQYQTPGPFDPSRQGMCDFHNGIYFPTRALLAGLSPYGAEYAETNPVARQIPFFLPSILALHAPLVLLPMHVGEVLFFILSVGVLLGIAWLLCSAEGPPQRFDVVLGITAVLVFSRAGHITLYDGYFTFELVLATFLAIHWGERRPWLAALALAVASAKPTYILPLGFLMLVRGNVKAIVIGAVISILAAAIPLLWLAWNEGEGDVGKGIAVLAGQIAQTQEVHRAQEDESPLHSWTRIDLLAVLAKWTGEDPKELTHLLVMAVILAPAMWVLDRRRRWAIDDGLTGLTGGIIVTAMLVSLYHQSYDALLLAAPLAGMGIGHQAGWQRTPVALRVGLGLAMLVPLYNYFSTRMILGWLAPDPLVVRILTSVNGVLLAIALVVLLRLGMWRTQPSRPA
jgi:hypothetical protein